jgi:phosphoribosyl 1,2-cyclic phosphodiesterase
MMEIKFWGVRGSIPTPGRETVKYGGDTACIEVQVDGEFIILDAGTGIRRLGLELVNRSASLPIEAHILITHTHWDHIQGLLFFAPAFMPQNKFTIYSCKEANRNLQRLLLGQMKNEYFPVSLEQMAADIQFVELQPGTFQIGTVQITAMLMNHPCLAFGYRIVSSDGKTVVYTGDTEPYHRPLYGHVNSTNTKMSDQAQNFSDNVESKVSILSFDTLLDFDTSLRPGFDMSPSATTQPGASIQASTQIALNPSLLQFADSADLLIFDAQYTPEEYNSKFGWGHSQWDYAVKVGLKAQARQLALFHHDPTRSDDEMDEIVEKCRAMIKENGSSLECFGAQVGQQIIL